MNKWIQYFIQCFSVGLVATVIMGCMGGSSDWYHIPLGYFVRSWLVYTCVIGIPTVLIYQLNYKFFSKEKKESRELSTEELSTEELSIEELRKIPLLNEKWIGLGFEFPFPDSKFSQLSKQFLGENPTREDMVIGFVFPYLGRLGRIKTLACSVNKKTTPPTVRIMFPDRSKEGDLRISEDECRLSPIGLMKYQDCFQSIEGILLSVFGFENIKTGDRSMVEFYVEGLDIREELTEKEIRKKPLMVERTDNILYFNYPLEKRVELFSEHEEAEKWLSKNLFGYSFKEFIDFIMKKEGTQDMEIYCSEVRKLLEKYDIPVEQYQD